MKSISVAHSLTGIVAAAVLLSMISGMPLAQAQTAPWAEGGGWFYWGAVKNNFGFYVFGGTWDGWHYLHPEGWLYTLRAG